MSNKTNQLQKKNKNMFCTFPYKLWQLLDECTDGVIRWSDTGKSIIMDKTLFHTSIFVQRIFKSIQWTSFVRQLNMYGFHKILPIHQHSQEEPCPCNCHVVTSIYYTHEHFRRWNFNDLTLVTRPKKSKSGFLNTVTENTKDVNGNASQPKPLAIEVKNEPQELVNWSEVTVPVDMLPGPEPNLDLLEDVNGNASQPKPRAIEDIKSEPQELVNWSEATVPVDILPGPESNLDLLEQNSVDQKNSFSMDIDVDIDRSMEMHPFFHVVPSVDDAETCTGMTDSSNMYCQLRNVSQPIPTSAIAVQLLYFPQSDDIEDLEDKITVTLEVVSCDDGDESMEVDMHQFELNVEWCDDVGDRNETENY